MAPRKASERVLPWLLRHEVITEPVFAELVREFPDIKPRTLRAIVRESGLPQSPLVEGVRQDSFPELARTLSALQFEYEAAASPQRRQQIRSIVLESKTHARFASRRDPQKSEMVEWMLVWLADPSLFHTWSKLRLANLPGPTPDTSPS